jgi:hypothetical protein
MRRLAIRTAWLALLLLLTACSANPEGTGVRRSGSTDVILQEEIAAVDRSTAYETIEYLRPQWLRTRSDQSALRPGGIVVYLNETRFGDVNSLRQIAARDIQRMERFNTTAASQRWGPGHSEGVILISTRRTD